MYEFAGCRIDAQNKLLTAASLHRWNRSFGPGQGGLAGIQLKFLYSAPFIWG